jgi:hypothetical protein
MCYGRVNSSPAYGVYVFQLIRYSRACGSYQDFLDRGLLLTQMLLNQGFLFVKLKPSLRKIEIIFLFVNYCQFRDVGQVMKQTYLYLWYPLFQLNEIDAITQSSKRRIV